MTKQFDQNGDALVMSKYQNRCRNSIEKYVASNFGHSTNTENLLNENQISVPTATTIPLISFNNMKSPQGSSQYLTSSISSLSNNAHTHTNYHSLNSNHEKDKNLPNHQKVQPFNAFNTVSSVSASNSYTNLGNINNVLTSSTQDKQSHQSNQHLIQTSNNNNSNFNNNFGHHHQQHHGSSPDKFNSGLQNNHVTNNYFSQNNNNSRGQAQTNVHSNNNLNFPNNINANNNNIITSSPNQNFNSGSENSGHSSARNIPLPNFIGNQDEKIDQEQKKSYVRKLRGKIIEKVDNENPTTGIEDKGHTESESQNNYNSNNHQQFMEEDALLQASAHQFESPAIFLAQSQKTQEIQKIQFSRNTSNTNNSNKLINEISCNEQDESIKDSINVTRQSHSLSVERSFYTSPNRLNSMQMASSQSQSSSSNSNDQDSQIQFIQNDKDQSYICYSLEISKTNSEQSQENQDEKKKFPQKFSDQLSSSNLNEKSENNSIYQQTENSIETSGNFDKNWSPKFNPNDENQLDITSSFLDVNAQGQVIQWKQGEFIGSGQFGQVYKAMNCNTGEIFAVKKIFLRGGVIKDYEQQNNLSDSQYADSTQKELEITQFLDHQHIIKYYGHERIDDYLYIYLEYMSGGNISGILQKYGAFNEELIASYARQILEGIQYMHQQKVIHKDIKGANILVGKDGTVKLADFGSSKQLEITVKSLGNENIMKGLAGTVPWMAPEVVKQSQYGVSADIWSFGCTILEMATAKTPWSNYNFDNPFAAIVTIGMKEDLPEIPDHLSEELIDFIKICLNRKPDLRPTATELLSHQFITNQIK